MKLHDATLSWLIEMRHRVDRATYAHLPSSGWCGTSDFLYNNLPPERAARRAFMLAGVRSERSGRSGYVLESVMLRPATEETGDDVALFYATCRALHGLQPLYLIPVTPDTAERRAAQSLLICSLYQLGAWLGEVPLEVTGRDMFLPSTPRHPEFAAYLLRELQLAKEVGVLPLTAGNFF